jgi:hypothetical protein
MGSYDTYARSFEQFCLFLLRRKRANPQIPAIEFKQSARQERSFIAFSDFVLDPGNLAPTADQPCNEYDSGLDELLFEILESLFYLKLVPVDGITCPTDLILMLLWLKNDGSAIAPSGATHHCAVFQYWAYTTVVHTLRLRLTKLLKYREYSTNHSLGLSFNDPDDESVDLAENVEKCVITYAVLGLFD